MRLAQDLDRHGEAGRARTDQVLRAPDEQRDVLDHQHDGEGREQLEQFRRLVDAPQNQHLDQHADQPDRERRQDDRAPEAEGVRPSASIRRVGAVEAQHVERAVREIDDPRHAEDQRQAGRHQEQRRRGGQPVQELDDDAGEGHVTSCGRAHSSGATFEAADMMRDWRLAVPDDQLAGLIFFTSASDGSASLPSTKRHSFM